MPLVYACVCPTLSPPPKSRAASTLAIVARELAAHEVQTAMLLYARSQNVSILTANEISIDCGGEHLVWKTDRQLADRITARHVGRPLELRHQYDRSESLAVVCGLKVALTRAEMLAVAGWTRSVRSSLELGRAVGPALVGYPQRVAIVCGAELSNATDPAAKSFTHHYRDAIDSWDVKWLTGLDADLRRRAGEHAVAQTAVLMGALSSYRIQPRVLASDASGFVAAIDVLGARKKDRARSQGVTNG